MTPHCCNCRHWSEPTWLHDSLRPCMKLPTGSSHLKPEDDDVDIDTDYGSNETHMQT